MQSTPRPGKGTFVEWDDAVPYIQTGSNMQTSKPFTVGSQIIWRLDIGLIQKFIVGNTQDKRPGIIPRRMQWSWGGMVAILNMKGRNT